MNGKVALITGGATGIGKKTAEALAASGNHIAVTYRTSEQKAKELVTELEGKFGIRAFAFQSDSADESNCNDLIECVKEHMGTIDILIHNAGPYIHERKSMADYSSEEWNYLINGNLNGFFYLAKEAVLLMREKRWGRIITLGFERSETAPGWVYRSAFAAAKAGLTSLTKTLAMEEAANGITVNMVCPGDIYGGWKERSIEDAQKETDKDVPVGRPGTGEDLARMIAFLCDSRSDFITGSVIPVTGGKDVLGKIYQD
ncbi:SDR family oxidoreductase [Peribacillus saganii]|uniref:SDR family oxidoreductase n=1 Tax=Peribacillus saganii TaxID=2303992 RepID=A0A372LJ32_9BACI|nr:SDR family oxidoreductase [Peribacillus saganii]RFU66429.1 SDR family oxidoreductase [Peribacillus saganii]